MIINSAVVSIIIGWLAIAPCAAARHFGILPRTHRYSTLQITRPTWTLRGGADEASLDEKVHDAMRKLGLALPPLEPDESEATCEGDVCSVPPSAPTPTQSGLSEKEAGKVAKDIADNMGVDLSLAWAALGATAILDEETGSRTFNEESARDIIRQELAMIDQIPEDSANVETLKSEGYDGFLSRRALAFAENNLDDARAILLADRADQEIEEEAATKSKSDLPPPPPLTTVSVDKDFDPTRIDAATQPANESIKPATKKDVVFEATSGQIQELVLESPVPVLLDVYADWCGPCKVLGPALEEMAVKAGGAFRLVKLNTDNERSVSGALEVTSLPTVFGIKDGKILNMFVGMPKSEDAMKNFMMGLMIPGAKFNPPVTPDEAKQYEELSRKLVKVAAVSSYSFSARERLNDRVASWLDHLSEEAGGVIEADDSASVIRSLLSNIVRDPYNEKFRAVNLQNKVIAAKVGRFPACLSILKGIGFVKAPDGTKMVLGEGKRVVNVAPVVVARDCIDKWVDTKRYEVAKAARRKQDESDRAKVQAKLEAQRAEEPEDDDDVDEVDRDACFLKVRIDGKNKVHELDMHADDPLEDILDRLQVTLEDGQITCVAKKLVVKATDTASLGKSLRELGLFPKAALVVAVEAKDRKASSSLSERAAEKAKKKTGSHTMQSIGIYSKDDNAKGELIDGGGGVWYEQDVSDEENSEDEEAAATEEETEDASMVDEYDSDEEYSESE